MHAMAGILQFVIEREPKYRVSCFVRHLCIYIGGREGGVENKFLDADLAVSIREGESEICLSV